MAGVLSKIKFVPVVFEENEYDEVVLSIFVLRTWFEYKFSLARHHFDRLDVAKAKEANSIMYHDLGIDEIKLDCLDLGQQLIKLLGDNTYGILTMDCQLTAFSGRLYQFDRVGGSDVMNHFFVLRGPKVWNSVPQDCFALVKCIREYKLWEELGFGDTKAIKQRAVGLLEGIDNYKKVRPMIVTVSDREDILKIFETTPSSKQKKSSKQPSKSNDEFLEDLTGGKFNF
jgi:hypothetical protein